MFIDDDFLKLHLKLPKEPWKDGEPRSPDRRRALIEAWIADLDHAGLLTGYDRNVLEQWRNTGFNNSRPQLSVEINAPYAELEATRHHQRELAIQRAEQRGLEAWLEAAQARWDKDQENELLRCYPISYPEHLRRCKEEKERERQEALRKCMEQAAERERLRLEQEERQRLHRQMEQDRAELAEKIAAYAMDPLNASFDLTEGEFNHWCEEIATPEEIDKITEALAIAGRFHALPAWQRWLHRQLAPLLA